MNKLLEKQIEQKADAILRLNKKASSYNNFGMGAITIGTIGAVFSPLMQPDGLIQAGAILSMGVGVGSLTSSALSNREMRDKIRDFADKHLEEGERGEVVSNLKKHSTNIIKIGIAASIGVLGAMAIQSGMINNIKSDFLAGVTLISSLGFVGAGMTNTILGIEDIKDAKNDMVKPIKSIRKSLLAKREKERENIELNKTRPLV